MSNWILTDNPAGMQPESDKLYFVTVFSKFLHRTDVILAYYDEKDGWCQKDMFMGKGDRIFDMVLGWQEADVPATLPAPSKQEPYHKFPSFRVNKNGVNQKIELHLKSAEEMKAMGFYLSEDMSTWYFSRILTSDICFDISVNSEDASIFRIDVLDENFGQPYDYQAMISEPRYDEPPKTAVDVYNKVEELMKKFSDAGFITGHVEGEYI